MCDKCLAVSAYLIRLPEARLGSKAYRSLRMARNGCFTPSIWWGLRGYICLLPVLLMFPMTI